VPAQRVLQRVAIDFSGQLVDQHGEPAAPAGTVTVDITKADGTAVVTGGTVSGSGTDPRTYSLAAASNLELQLFTAVWKDGGTERLRTLVETTGGFYFDKADVLARYQLSLGDAVAFRRVRLATEAECERVTGAAWVPRYARLFLDGTGMCELVLPDGYSFPRTVRSGRLYSSATSYTSLTSDQIAAIECREGGILIRRDGAVWPGGTSNIVLEIEHGRDRPPEDLREAAILRFKTRWNDPKTIDLSRFQRFQNPDGSSADIAPTELDIEQASVLRVYRAYSKRVPGLA
jgi:hypothetical protein